MTRVPPCLEDDREICAIWDGPGGHQVGLLGVTKIVAYGEPGMHCDLPFLAVYKGDEISVRVSALKVSIVYSNKRPKDAP